jgi:hypothetical protein
MSHNIVNDIDCQFEDLENDMVNATINEIGWKRLGPGDVVADDGRRTNCAERIAVPANFPGVQQWGQSLSPAEKKRLGLTGEWKVFGINKGKATPVMTKDESGNDVQAIDIDTGKPKYKQQAQVVGDSYSMGAIMEGMKKVVTAGKISGAVQEAIDGMTSSGRQVKTSAAQVRSQLAKAIISGQDELVIDLGGAAGAGGGGGMGAEMLPI